MSSDPQAPLIRFRPKHDFLIGIDSDGCAFDTMEPKHKECFCPATVWKFDLAAVSKYAREAWDFVNLYSKTRGCNRFLALLRVLDLLDARKEVKARGVRIPRLPELREWVRHETKLGNPALEAEVMRTESVELGLVLDWSKTINAAVAHIVRNVPPYPCVRESLERLSMQADCIVVSATPGEALEREWREHDIARYAAVIAGQEMGKKSEHLALAAGGKYAPDHVLMVGDAPGDMEAARKNRALFYPVLPGREEESWERFHSEALDRFFGCSYAGEYETALIAEFNTLLPQAPPWE